MAVNIFDDPLFTPRDVSMFLDIPKSTVYSWLAAGDGQALVHRIDAGHGKPSVPFAALVEAYVLRALRELGFTRMQIADTVRDVRSEFGHDFALASNRIGTDGIDIFLRHADGAHVRVGDHQRPIEPVIEDYLRYITFGAEGGQFPTSLQLRRFPDSAAVIVDPRFGWGDPVVRATKVPVHQVVDLWKGGESIETVAHEYGLTPSQVESICRAQLQSA